MTLINLLFVVGIVTICLQWFYIAGVVNNKILCKNKSCSDKTLYIILAFMAIQQIIYLKPKYNRQYQNYDYVISNKGKIIDYLINDFMNYLKLLFVILVVFFIIAFIIKKFNIFSKKHDISRIKLDNKNLIISLCLVYYNFFISGFIDNILLINK